MNVIPVIDMSYGRIFVHVPSCTLCRRAISGFVKAPRLASWPGGVAMLADLMHKCSLTGDAAGVGVARDAGSGGGGSGLSTAASTDDMDAVSVLESAVSAPGRILAGTVNVVAGGPAPNLAADPAGVATLAGISPQSSAPEEGDGRDVQTIGYTLYLTGDPIRPCAGRPGRKAAMARISTVVPDGFVMKAIPCDNGKTIRGTLYDASTVPGFLRHVAPIGRAEITSKEKHLQQIAIDASYKKARQMEADSMILPQQFGDLLKALSDIRGNGGTKRAREQFANNAVEILTVGQRAAACASKQRLGYALENHAEDEEDEDQRRHEAARRVFFTHL